MHPAQCSKFLLHMSAIKLPKLSLQVVSSQRGLQRVESILGAVKSIWNLGEDTYKRIRTSVTDAVKKAIQQNKGDESKTLTIGMRCAGKEYEFTVQDESQEGGKGNCVRMTFESDTSAK
jgi:hypothetical protein